VTWSASRRAAAGRGSVGFLGLARAERDATLGRLAMLAVVAGLGVAVFAGVSGSTVGRGIDRAAQLQVGSDAAVAGFGWDDETVAKLATAPGLARVAPAHLENQVTLRRDSGSPRSFVALVAADLPALAEVQAGRVSDALDAATVARLRVPAGADDPVPVLLSADAAAAAELGPDGRTELTIGGRLLPVRVVGVRGVLAGLPAERPWLLVDRAGLRQRTRLELTVQRVLTRTDSARPDAATVLAAIRPLVPDVLAVQTQAGVAAAAAGTPLPRTVRGALGPVLAIGCAYAAAAVAVALLAGARRRGRFVAHLRAVGLSTGQAGRLVVAEVAPICVLGLLLGTAVGLGLARVLLPVADLSQLTGSPVPAELSTDVRLLGLTVAALAVSVAVSVAVAAVVARRVSPSAAARTIEGE
jgi:putative ABC transport system permease protein